MPVYEYYCADCHTIYQFLSKRIRTDARPACPRCGRADLRRQVSPFAAPRGSRGGSEGGAAGDLDESRLERAMASMESEMAGLDENDPRQMARFMRRFSEATGMTVPGLDEAIRRLEAGEDPEQVEEELGPLFGDGEEGGGSEDGAPPEGPSGTRAASGMKRLRGRLAPRRDDRLYPLG
jgi:putative FmdB family regulatory protein